jgi:hypothetical protein
MEYYRCIIEAAEIAAELVAVALEIAVFEKAGQRNYLRFLLLETRIHKMMPF